MTENNFNNSDLTVEKINDCEIYDKKMTSNEGSPSEVRCNTTAKNGDCYPVLEKMVSNKDLAGQSHCDYEDVDIESFIIDDIFNETPSNDDWNNSKDNLQIAYPGEEGNIVSVNCEISSLIQPHQPRLQFDSNYFFITDILNEDRIYHAEEKFNNNISFSLNDSFTTNKSLINKNFSIVKRESETPLYINTYDAGLSYTVTDSQSVSLNTKKNKAILPFVGSSNAKQMGKYCEQLCFICSDIATGRHYGVISCEGCKGFFKRTIRNNLTYRCRDFDACSVNKKFRNRCQACRFQKCVTVGMKREAVQTEKREKRNKTSEDENSQLDSVLPSKYLLLLESLKQTHGEVINLINDEMMLLHELKYNPDVEATEIFEGNLMEVISEMANDHLFSIVTWAKFMPGFDILDVSDQTLLLKMCWGELIIANSTHRSMKLSGDVILLRNGSKLFPEMAKQSGIGKVLDRIIFEILHRFRDLNIDRCELCYMKAIILFNPNLKDLSNRPFIQIMRDKLYCSLQNYCIKNYPTEKLRFCKLLLRLPSLRSMAHISLDNFRLYELFNKADKVDIDVEKRDQNNKGRRVFDFFNEMLQHADIILDH